MQSLNSRRRARIGAAAAIVALGVGAVRGQDAPSAPMAPPNCADPAVAGEVCVRFVGCVAATGEVFDGRALGAGLGRLDATTTRGRVCAGGWTILPGGLGGVANGFCGPGVGAGDQGDETPFVAYYTYLEPVTGTAEASGFFGTQALTALSGRAIPDYLRGQGALDGAYQCGDVTYPLS